MLIGHSSDRPWHASSLINQWWWPVCITRSLQHHHMIISSTKNSSVTWYASTNVRTRFRVLVPRMEAQELGRLFWVLLEHELGVLLYPTPWVDSGVLDLLLPRQAQQGHRSAPAASERAPRALLDQVPRHGGQSVPSNIYHPASNGWAALDLDGSVSKFWKLLRFHSLQICHQKRPSVDQNASVRSASSSRTCFDIMVLLFNFG
jgi:hypothetical protein